MDKSNVQIAKTKVKISIDSIKNTSLKIKKHTMIILHIFSMMRIMMQT